MFNKKKIEFTILQAGEIIKQNFEKNIRYDTKSTQFDLVTETDRRVEIYLKEKLKELTPEADFLAEETDSLYSESELLWIIDPIDGTTNFVHKFPFFCISVALSVNNKLQLAYVYNPITGDLYEAEKNAGSYLNKKQIFVSEVTSLTHSLLATGFPYDYADNPENNLGYFDYFLKQVHGIRRAGSAALDLCMVASGAFDGFWEWHLNPWDVAAGVLIVQEANGRISDINGDLFTFDSSSIVAANPEISVVMLEKFKDFANQRKAFQ
ncbi:MAG: inositol monophosphatase family protein [Candidatus Cloacimonetes bacterium]|nr:inositol monophosphatase family protein [Candidatus Cloacimonadota bacterium]